MTRVDRPRIVGDGLVGRVGIDPGEHVLALEIIGMQCAPMRAVGATAIVCGTNFSKSSDAALLSTAAMAPRFEVPDLWIAHVLTTSIQASWQLRSRRGHEVNAPCKFCSASTGWVAENVIRRSTRPVLVVRAPPP